jgi:hypothetical protein
MVPSPADRRRPAVLVILLLTAALVAPVAAQAPPPPPPMPQDANVVRLQLRVFDGVDDVTREARVRVFPAGQRTEPIRMILGSDQAYEAEVPVGLYDVQAIRERAGAVSGVRWVERLLVQRYPDEGGRHLQVVNLKGGFGALQIRPEGSASGPAGWTAVATPPGTPDAEVAKARPFGPDLLLVVPAGTYNVKVVVPSAAPAWITGIEIPEARTRLKTWPLP